MSKLLRANFAKLWKGSIFWINIGLTLLAVLQSIVDLYLDYSPIYPSDFLDRHLFTGGIYIVIIVAIFISIFIGTEYSDGTIRNKLIVGHTRYTIYFSNLIVCISALLIMYFTYFIMVTGIGTFLFNIRLNLGTNITLYFIYILAIIALCSLFLCISMLICSKSTGAVTLIILSILLLIIANNISSSLKRPEYYYSDAENYIDDTHIEQFVEKNKNPRYLEGTKRGIYTFFYDLLPSGQMLQLANGELYKSANLSPDLSSNTTIHYDAAYYESLELSKTVTLSPYPLVRLPLYSIGIIIVTTILGTFFFQRKELK